MPYSAVRNLLVQKDLGEKRAHWVTTLQEYDLEIKPLKIVRGQGLCKLASGSSDMFEFDLHFIDEHFLFEREVLPILSPSYSWYHDIKFFLLHGNALEHLDSRSKRALRLRSAPYQLIDNILFKNNFEGVLLRFLERNEFDSVLPQLHAGPAEAHFGEETTAHEVLKSRYY